MWYVLKVAVELNHWAVTHPLECWSLWQNRFPVRRGFTCQNLWWMLMGPLVCYRQVSSCHVVVAGQGFLHLHSVPMGSRTPQNLWRFEPGAVFLQRAKWIHAESHGRDVLWSGDLNYFRGVSHPNEPFGLGMQCGSSCSQWQYWNIKDVGKLPCYGNFSKFKLRVVVSGILPSYLLLGQMWCYLSVWTT